MRNGRPLLGLEVARKPPRKPEGGRAGALVSAKGLKRTRKLGRRLRNLNPQQPRSSSPGRAADWPGPFQEAGAEELKSMGAAARCSLCRSWLARALAGALPACMALSR
jgi:hypothetical protein